MNRFELVSTVDRFIELERAWEVLWHQTGSRVFQSHPWLAAWVSDMDRRFELRVGLIWCSDGKLAAALPMAVRKFLSIRILEWAGQATCDYCDGLGSSAEQRDAWTAMQSAGGFDIVRLKNIGPDAGIADLLGSGQLYPTDVCLKVISNWTSGDAWFRTLNKKKRNNFSRGQRILEEMGKTSMICHEQVEDEALAGTLIELKKAWLKSTKTPLSYLFEPEHSGRLLRLMQALARVGRLRVFIITCDNEVVSASINIAEGVSLCAFFATYNPRFDRVSPGIMLMTAYTRWAFNNGFTEIDYLQGGERYKFEFANAETILSSFVTAANFRGRIALMIYNRLLSITRLRQGARPLSRTGGAYTTKAGTVRTAAVAR
jgi:CelD/BcsL family acetyltransferase involved in cellulose biosynthesis